MRRLFVAACLALAAADLAVMAWRGLRASESRRAGAAAAGAPEDAPRLAAYYFYGNIRCVTCREMERLAGGALAGTPFSFHVENYQEPGNEGRVREFGLVSTSLVLAEERGGRAVRHRTLEGIWDRAEDPEAFKAYVRDEAASFLAGEEPEAAGPRASAGGEGGPRWRLYALAIATAAGLGLLTAVSPCPMATNIAAISFLGRHASSPRRVLAYGLLYACGRTVAYAVLGAALVGGLLAAPAASLFLSRHMGALLGPALLLSGLIILGLLEFNLGPSFSADRLGAWAARGGAPAAAGLGALFAMAFCPTSAALFFGGLVPLAIENGSPLVLPCAYGMATGLPVMAFAFVVALASHAVGRVFDRVAHVERVAHTVAGVLFLLFGVYYSAVHIMA